MTAVLDKAVTGIEVVSPGRGYALSVPLAVTIEPPGACGGTPGGAQAFGIGTLTMRHLKVLVSTYTTNILCSQDAA